MPSSVQQTFVGRENRTDTKNGCKEARDPCAQGRLQATYFTIRRVALSGYGSMPHAAKLNGLLTRGL